MLTPSEQRLCCAIGICLLIAVLSGVSLLYLSVFIYLPAQRTLAGGFEDLPVVCRTIQAGKDLKEGCTWGTCSEWCLSKSTSSCMQIWVYVRQNGTDTTFFNCTKYEKHYCTPYSPEYITPLNCSDHPSCREIDGLFNCSKKGVCRYVTPFYECQESSKTSTPINCNIIERCNELEGIYMCKKGLCSQINTTCERRCEKLPITGPNYRNLILFVGDGIAAAYCTGIDKTANWESDTVFFGKCSTLDPAPNPVKVITDIFDIAGEDCVDGVFLSKRSIPSAVNYTQLLDIYERILTNTTDGTDIAVSHQEVFPYESQIEIVNRTRLQVNLEGCVNSLRDECNTIYGKIGRDGTQFGAPAIYPCYYSDKYLNSFVILKYNRDATLLEAVLFATVPSALFVVSCFCLCFCSKFVYVDGSRMKMKLCTSTDEKGGNLDNLTL